MGIQVQTQVHCHFLLQEMKLTITPQVVVNPFLWIKGIRCHHGNKTEEETTKEEPYLNQVIHRVQNFFQGAQEITEQISYDLQPHSKSLIELAKAVGTLQCHSLCSESISSSIKLDVKESWKI